VVVNRGKATLFCPYTFLVLSSLRRYKPDVYIGTIFTIAQLDREAQREHILFIEVDDQGVPGALQVSKVLNFIEHLIR